MQTKLLMLLTLCLTIPSVARIAPISLEDLVQRSDLIAVVNVTEVKEPSEHEQIATFESVRVLKGSLRDGHSLYQGQRSRCARPSYQPGSYLLFLCEQDGQWVAAYHIYSVFEIKDNKLSWFAANPLSRRQENTLQKAESDIRQLISTTR